MLICYSYLIDKIVLKTPIYKPFKSINTTEDSEFISYILNKTDNNILKESKFLNNNNYSDIFIPNVVKNLPFRPYIPVGMIIDRGMSTSTLSDYQECYGHGQCLGLARKFLCFDLIHSIIFFL